MMLNFIIKKHEDFVTTMTANEDKIQGVCSFAQRSMSRKSLFRFVKILPKDR